MKQETFTRIFWIIFGVIVAALALYKIDNYFNARIAYEEMACSDRAYMIEKGYDDQPEGVRRADRVLRIEECAKISAEYQKGW